MFTLASFSFCMSLVSCAFVRSSHLLSHFTICSHLRLESLLEYYLASKARITPTISTVLLCSLPPAHTLCWWYQSLSRSQTTWRVTDSTRPGSECDASPLEKIMIHFAFVFSSFPLLFRFTAGTGSWFPDFWWWCDLITTTFQLPTHVALCIWLATCLCATFNRLKMPPWWAIIYFMGFEFWFAGSNF